MSLVDFAALPPEVNSARIYTGAGAGPLVAAASAWDGVAAELGSAAQSYETVLSELSGGPWLGRSSASATAAASEYIGWINTTAAQAEQTANQARAAVAAYEAAFAATVPPPLIAANRAQFAYLTVTNVFGQNTPAIAATEAQYADYWAQDAAAMYNYAGNSAAATTLTAFSPAQQNTNQSASGAQAAAVSQASGNSTASNSSDIVSQILNSVPNALQQLASGGSFDPAGSWDNLLNTPAVLSYENWNYTLTSGYSLWIEGATFLGCGVGITTDPMIMAPIQAGVAASAAAVPVEGAAGAAAGLTGSSGPAASTVGSAAAGAAPVSAGLGEAATVGGLSVPHEWATAAPEIRLASTALPTASLEALPMAAAAGTGSLFSGIPVMGNVVNASRGSGADSRSGSDRKKARHALGRSGIHEDVPAWSVSPGRFDIEGRFSERDELIELRKVAADLAKERDVLKRSAAMLIHEAVQR